MTLETEDFNNLGPELAPSRLPAAALLESGANRNSTTVIDAFLSARA